MSASATLGNHSEPTEDSKVAILRRTYCVLYQKVLFVLG